MDNNLYSTLALSHFPFFFDVVCTQVHCLPINDNYENNVFKKIVRILPSMSLDSIVVSSVVSVSGPYTELHKCVNLHCSCFGTQMLCLPTNCGILL